MSFEHGGSLPSRGRGLKSVIIIVPRVSIDVAPFTGAWIEISIHRLRGSSDLRVAPFTGAWIEIFVQKQKRLVVLSLPSRGRGLKFFVSRKDLKRDLSLPSRGRGLKYEPPIAVLKRRSRSLHGGVD